MAKFKVGDRVRLKYVRWISSGKWYEGAEVEITYIVYGEHPNGPYDCIVETLEGVRGLVLFDQLEPIIDLGNWDEIEQSIGWNPTKTAVESLETA